MSVELIKLRALDPGILGRLSIYGCWQDGGTHKRSRP